jgi:hypothetical protein
MLFLKNLNKKILKKTKKNIINKLIVSRFFKNKINLLLINFVSFIIRLHINSIMCYLLCPDINTKDFILQIIVSISTTLSGDFILYILNKCEDDFYKITRYFLNNYSEENLDKWKKILVVGVNIYLIGSLLFVSINSYLLIYYSVQFLVCFFILDSLKKKKWKYFQNIYNDYLNKPEIIQKYETLQIIDNHFDIELKKTGIPSLKIETINNLNEEYLKISTNKKCVSPISSVSPVSTSVPCNTPKSKSTSFDESDYIILN